MENRLFVIARTSDAISCFFKKLKDNKVVFIPYEMGMSNSLFLNITRFLFVGRFPLPVSILRIWFDERLLLDLKKIKAQDRLLIIESVSPSVLGMIKHITPNTTIKYNWFLNPVYSIFKGKNPLKRLNKIKKLGYEILTFDIKDANKYQLLFHSQFFYFPSFNMEIKECFDFYFVGQPKDRAAYLIKLKEILEREGFRCSFNIPYPGEKWISYEENLQMVEKSKCIVDIYQQNQSGLTRRALEALFYNKKILTNNPFIKDYDFYNANNILVLNEQIDAAEIVEFMNKKLIEIPNEIKMQYDINNWIKRFVP